MRTVDKTYVITLDPDFSHEIDKQYRETEF